jgi:ABC-type multidrug transport system ATPase subunit
MIKRLNSSAVLMTTHRMEEAERLCDLIAIMVNGSIVCYGSPTYLMETYGGGYEIIVAVDVTKSSEKEVRR